MIYKTTFLLKVKVPRLFLTSMLNRKLCPKFMYKMEVCLICTNNIIDKISKSVFDIDDEHKIKIKDILFDLNFKICIKDIGSDSICYDCYVELLKIYNFRDECCILFNCEEDFVSCCQLCLKKTDDFKFLSDCILINNESLTVLEILNKICSYDLTDKYDGEQYVCKTCFKTCLDNYPFFLKCEKATEYWNNFTLNKNRQTRESSSFDFSITEENSAIVETEESDNGAYKPYELTDHDYCKSDTESMISNGVHNNELFHCHTCMKPFECKTQLIKHINVHTNSLREKQTLLANENYVLLVAKHKSLYKRVKNKIKWPFLCIICSTSFYCESDLKQHIKTVHLNIAKYSYKCDLCPKEFKENGSLTKHKFLHTGERPFMCEKCSKTFPTKNNLKVHSLSHIEEKSHECDICLKKFTYKRLLDLHKRNHSDPDIRPYKCDLCLKAFKKKSHVSRHKTIHNTERVFKCATCSKAFYSELNLVTHKKLHSVRKLHKCQLCLREFTTPYNLKLHLLNNVCTSINKDKFICEFCSKEFPLLRALQIHRKVVHINDEKTVNNGPFKCDTCKKEYKLLRILKIHMGMIHNKKINI